MSSIEEVLKEFEELGGTFEDDEPEVIVFSTGEVSPTPPSEKEKAITMESHSQWAIGANDSYMPIGASTPKLPAGIYETFSNQNVWGLAKMHITSDGIYTLPDMATEEVLKEVHTFWSNESKYRAHNLLYKRGLLLHGPPGGGKTVTIKLIMNELVKRDGVVIITRNVGLTTMCLKAIRRIEPKRNLIGVLEDIDEIINYSGEAAVLSMLDGEDNVDNILYLASTNFPERLPARIANRPSRFDRMVKVGMPSDQARRVYLEKATNGGLNPTVLDRWVKETNEMSIAHLRELVAAVYCLDQPYDEVLDRLKKMAVQSRSDEEFKRKGGSVGFKSSYPSVAIYGNTISGNTVR